MFRRNLFVAAIVLMLPNLCMAQSKITLMFYLDMSDSMGPFRKQVAKMAEDITTDLEINCGQFDAVVSNIRYADEFISGGEIIAYDQEPEWITEKNPKAKRILEQRIAFDNTVASHQGRKAFTAGTLEKTYTSIYETAPLHLMNSPRRLQRSDAVGIFILSDAAPIFEKLDPIQAAASLPALFQGSPVIVGSLGAESACMDMSGANQSDKEQSLDWLEKFSKATGGYHWNICAAHQKKEKQKIETAVRDFIMMLMDLGQCRLMA